MSNDGTVAGTVTSNLWIDVRDELPVIADGGFISHRVFVFSKIMDVPYVASLRRLAGSGTVWEIDRTYGVGMAMGLAMSDSVTHWMPITYPVGAFEQ